MDCERLHSPTSEAVDGSTSPASLRRRAAANKWNEPKKLHAEVESARRYPYPFVSFRITEFRSDAHADLLIPGDELKHDLLLFIKRLERSMPAVPIEQAVEPMLTLDQISKQFNVSTKTVGRWRVRGLVGQRVIIKGRQLLAFPKSVVEGFLTTHQKHVERGSRFSHLTDDEKADILRRARRLCRSGGCLTEISKRIASKLGRSVETIRYTIKNFDLAHPDKAIFPDAVGPLNGAEKLKIVHSYQNRKGLPVQTLAKTYNRTRKFDLPPCQ